MTYKKRMDTRVFVRLPGELRQRIEDRRQAYETISQTVRRLLVKALESENRRPRPQPR